MFGWNFLVAVQSLDRGMGLQSLVSKHLVFKEQSLTYNDDIGWRLHPGCVLSIACGVLNTVG